MSVWRRARREADGDTRAAPDGVAREDEERTSEGARLDADRAARASGTAERGSAAAIRGAAAAGRVGQSAGDAAPARAGSEHSRVEGERATAAGARVRSLQSRASNVLALALMAALGVGLLGWYYARMLQRPAPTQAAAQKQQRARAEGEMELPALGRVDPPLLERVLGPPPAPPALDPDPLEADTARFAPAAYGSDPPPEKTAAELAFERRLAGPVFESAQGRGARSSSREISPSLYEAPPYRGEAPGSAGDGGGLQAAAVSRGIEEGGAGEFGVAAASSGNTSDLAALLTPSATPAVRAQVLPTQRLLLPKGAFLDCTLETAIDSSLPGMTTCITATPTFGADGTVVLMEAGTKLVGETRGQVRAGTARVFVLWTEARTPTGVVVPLASPGTDALGRAGLEGHVNRHFWERFGAAILVSVIDGAVQAAVQSGNESDTVIVNPSGSREIMTEILRGTIRIPPTVTKRNGDRIAVLVARDLDFRSVYELRPLHTPDR